MHEDTIFRIIMIAGFFVIIPIGMHYRIKSQAAREKLDRRQEGLFILFTLRPLGLMSTGGLIAYLFDPAWMAWSSVYLASWLRWTGVVLGVIAGFLLTWTYRSIGTNITDTVVTRKVHTLVTTGPYRWVRHPFYTSVALAILANSIVAANVYLFLTGGLVVVLLVIRTKREEKHLLERFGAQYDDYINRTGRFLPRLRTSLTPGK